MNVSLTPHLDAFIRAKIETGRYASPSEVVCEALRLLEQVEGVQQTRVAALRADVQRATKQIGREETTAFDADEIKREGRVRREQRSAEAYG